jgi:Cyclohydrolase (MCH)
VDHNVFAPAKVVMNEIKSRRTFVTGKVNPEVLAESFHLEALEPVRQVFKNPRAERLKVPLAWQDLPHRQ